MFFKESIVKNLLKCQRCKSDLDEYESEPKILPCGKTICFNCNLTIINKKKFSYFKCDLCLNDHSIPENGFSSNEFVLNLIKLQPTEVYRSQLCEKLKQNLVQMENLSNEYKYKMKNIEYFTRDHCDEQRRLIQLNKELEEEKIDQHFIKSKKVNDSLIFESFIDQIDDYEFELNNRKLKLTESDEMILDKVNTFILDNQTYLSEYQIDESTISQSYKDSIDFLSSLNTKLQNYKTNIFNNRLIKYNREENSIKFEKIKFVSLILYYFCLI
jgi:hypothetical protein